MYEKSSADKKILSEAPFAEFVSPKEAQLLFLALEQQA